MPDSGVDLLLLLPGAGGSASASPGYTADSTTITADSTLVTADAA